MTGMTLNWPLLSWPRKTKTTAPVSPEMAQVDTRQDLRREYVAEMIGSGACVGEYGAQALMTVFPKDF